jgi:membrane protease YdiL (CAAX protease family)
LNSAVRTAADAFFTLLGIAGIAAAVSCFSETLKIQGEESLFVVEDGAEIVVYIMLACGAAVEESFFRYFMINSFETAGFSLWSASLVPVVLFTLPHIWEGIPGLLMAFLAGLFFTAVYERRRALLPLILAHAVYNMAAFSLSL